MSKMDIIAKIAELDRIYNSQRYERTMTEEQMRVVRMKRDRLEAKLYRK